MRRWRSVGRSVSIIGPGRRYGVFSPSKGLFLGVSRVYLLVVIRVGVGVGRGCLGFAKVDQLLEVLCHDRAALARALDVDNVFLVDVVLLHEFGSTARDLALAVVRLVGLGGRLQVFDVLEKDLAVNARASDLGDVQPVVAAELLCAGRGVHLGLLGALCKRLQVLDRDLVIIGSAFKPFRNHDALGLGELLGRLAGKEADLLLLRLLRKLLRQVALRGEQGNSGVTVLGLGLHELVDDEEEGLRGGGHECCRG